MITDLSTKINYALWWITSIATSVVCCSILFVVFASYFVDVRNEIRAGNMRINSIAQREDIILYQIVMIRKHGLGQPAADIPVTGAPTPLAGEGQAPK